MTKELQSGVNRWMRAEWIALVIQFVILLVTMAAGYSRMQVELEQNRAEIRNANENKRDYVLRDTWDTRNKLIDSKLDRMESKIDRLLMERSSRGR